MKTHALVIGNNGYEQATVLNNAINDAEAISNKFIQLGYSVESVKDFKRDDIPDILSNFEKYLGNDIGVGIFYFAGHAFEIDNINYIAPIDCPISSRDLSNCKYYSLKLDDIISILDNSSCVVKIIILDACRNNPFKEGYRGEEDIKLAPVNVTRGYLIAYSTSPGKTASDSEKRKNSIYTEALLSHMDEKHLPIESVFKKVRETVYSLSSGSQVPWEHTSMIDNFCFNQGQIGFQTFSYDEEAIRDSKYIGNGMGVDLIINRLRSYDYNIQNPAIESFPRIDPRTVNKNQQFVLGRNILQSCENAWSVTNFINSIEDKIIPYQTPTGENHILNGILFEIYFDSKGEIRERFKNHHIDKIFSLQYNPTFKKSFEFICDALAPYRDYIYYMPDCSGRKLSVAVSFEDKEGEDIFGEKEIQHSISKISVGARDITNPIKYRFWVHNADKNALSKAIATQLTALSNDIQFNPDIPNDHLFLNR